MKQKGLEIKTHSHELQGQEGTKCTPKQKNATTTVSHLHDGMVLQFSKIIYHTKFQTNSCICFLIEVMSPMQYNECLKLLFLFSFFSSLSFESHTPTRELV